jgi:hypothetical protein
MEGTVDQQKKRIKPFIATVRGREDHWIFKKPERRGAWSWMLEEARYKPEKERVGDKEITVPRGSFLGSERGIARKLEWTRSKTRRFINALKEKGELQVIEIAHKIYLFTILTYEEWQGYIVKDEEAESQTIEITEITPPENEVKRKKCPTELVGEQKPARTLVRRIRKYDGVIGRLRLTSTGVYCLYEPGERPGDWPGDCPETTIKSNDSSRFQTSKKERKNTINTRKKKASKKVITEEDLPKDFMQFWDVYPNTENKSIFTTYEKWCELDPSPELVAEIIQAVEDYKQTNDWKKAGGKWIPSPFKFLEKRRWMDKIKTSKGKTETGPYKVL